MVSVLVSRSSNSGLNPALHCILGGKGVFLKKNNALTTSPNPTDFFVHSPGFELQASDFEVHLHLHYTTQAILAKLLVFVGLISYWSQTHTNSHILSWFENFNPV